MDLSLRSRNLTESQRAGHVLFLTCFLLRGLLGGWLADLPGESLALARHGVSERLPLSDYKFL